MNRRTFLEIRGIGLVSSGASYSYLQGEDMKRASQRNGKIIVDLHTHPSSNKNDQETLEMLCSPGVVGLTFTNEPGAKGVLSYEQTLERFSGIVEKIDEGLLSKITTSLGTGYFTKTQEITGGDYFSESVHHPHILAVGFNGDYLPNYKDARKSVEEIHKRGGVVILNHPYVTTNTDARIIKYRFITSKEERVIEELCDMVDEIEIFNAQCINPTLGIIVPDMKKANEKAELLAQKHKFKGIVSTDAHFRMEQPKICGIYVDEQGLSIERLKEDIRKGNFDNDYKKYVSKLSFLKGMFLE